MRISHAFRGWADLVSIALAFPHYSVRNASRPESIASAVRVRVLEDSRLPPSKVPVDTVSCVCECNRVMLRKDVRLTCRTTSAEHFGHEGAQSVCVTIRALLSIRLTLCVPVHPLRLEGREGYRWKATVKEHQIRPSRRFVPSPIHG